MFIKDWKKEIFTIPNILSMFRLVLIPVYVSIYLNADEASDYYLAASILAVSCLTDMIAAGEEYGARWVTAGKRSKAGHPHHPLYLRADSPLEDFDMEAYLNARL